MIRVRYDEERGASVVEQEDVGDARGDDALDLPLQEVA